MIGVRDLRRGRQQIVGERSGQKAAVLGIGIFFVERGADRLREAAAHLAVDHGRMQDRPAIVHGDVAIDPRFQRGAVDLDAAEVEDEAVAERGIDVIVFVGRGQFRRRPEHGLADGLSDAIGQRAPATSGSAPRRARTKSCCRDCASIRRGRRRTRYRRPRYSTGLPRCAASVRRCARRRAWRCRQRPARSGWRNCRTRSTRHPWRYRSRC